MGLPAAALSLGSPLVVFRGGADLSKGSMTPPWFGMPPAQEKNGRVATAVVLESTQLLVLPLANFALLDKLVPSFRDMAQAGTSALKPPLDVAECSLACELGCVH